MVDIDIPSEGIDLEEEVGKLEKHLILKALERTNGEMKKAAQLLNIPYRSIRYRLEKYGIKDRTFRENKTRVKGSSGVAD